MFAKQMSHAGMADQEVESICYISKSSARLAEIEKSAERDLELLFLDREPDAKLRDTPHDIELEKALDLPKRPSSKFPSHSVPNVPLSLQAQDRGPSPRPATKTSYAPLKGRNRLDSIAHTIRGQATHFPFTTQTSK